MYLMVKWHYQDIKKHDVNSVAVTQKIITIQTGEVSCDTGHIIYNMINSFSCYRDYLRMEK